MRRKGAPGVPSNFNVEFFPATALDGSGDATLTLARTPVAGKVFLVAMLNGGGTQGYVAQLQSVNPATKEVFARVRRAKSASLAHAPTTQNALARGTITKVSATQTGAAGSCIVGCGAAHPNSVVVQHAGVILSEGAALGTVAAVDAIPAHAAVALEAAAGDTVDLLVLYAT